MLHTLWIWLKSIIIKVFNICTIRTVWLNWVYIKKKLIIWWKLNLSIIKISISQFVCICAFVCECVSAHTYGWNSPGRTSWFGECHQNICTLGLLTRSFFIDIARDILRLVRNWYWTITIKINYIQGVQKKSKFPVKNWL